MIMKSNIKKFLSTLCVLTSVSGGLAPVLVNASSDGEKYGMNFCENENRSVCSSAAAAENVSVDPIVDIMCSLRGEDHQKFYDKVIELENKKLIDETVAVSLIVVDQLTGNGIKYISSISGVMINDSDVYDMIRSGNVRSIDSKIQTLNDRRSGMSFCIYPDDDLGYRALYIFSLAKGSSEKRFRFHMEDSDEEGSSVLTLDEALKKLNPSNPEGLRFDVKVYRNPNDNVN